MITRGPGTVSIRYGVWLEVGLGWEGHAVLGDGLLPWVMSLWEIITMRAGLHITIILAPRDYNKMSVAINLKRGKVYFGLWSMTGSHCHRASGIMGQYAAVDSAYL